VEAVEARTNAIQRTSQTGSEPRLGGANHGPWASPIRRPCTSRSPMPTSPLLDFYPWSYGFSLTRRTAVCGPACTVVWEGRTGNRLRYPDCARSLLRGNCARFSSAFVLRFVIATSPNLNWFPPNTRRGPVCICPCHIGGAAIHGVRCCEQGPGRLATMLTESILTPKMPFFVISYRSSLAAVTAAVKSAFPFLGNRFLVC
jgi:hypothetical protein